MYKTDLEKYESCWNDLSVFVKLGCLKDEDFYSKVKDIIIFKDLDGNYKTLDQFAGYDKKEETAEPSQEEKADETKTEEKKEPVTVYYVSDEVGQAQYISMFKSSGLNALVCDSFIDPHFISYIEFKESGKFKFLRIDADVDSALKEEGEKADTKDLEESFKAALKNTTIAVKAEKFKSDTVPAIINVSEYSRRFGEMNAFYGLEGADTDRDMTIVLNTSNPIIASFPSLDEEKKKFVANQVYYLAMLSYKKLSPDEMKDFSDNMAALLKQYIG